MSGAETCCKSVRISGFGFPRYRACGKPSKSVVDGKHYCGIHDPVRKKAADEKRHKEWCARHNAKTAFYRLQGAAPDLLRELEHLTRCLGPWLDSGHSIPGIATLNGARAAIAKAKGE